MNSRNQSLDVLRGVAVLLIIGFHFQLIPVISSVGWCGVDLFFVLSGFLISGLLFREYQATGTIRIGRFWLRRGLKIWPALYVFLLCLLPVGLYIPIQWKSFVASALYFSDYVAPWSPLGHTWTLAIEEHFYFVLPLLLIVLIKKRKLQWIPGIYVALALLCLCFRQDLRFAAQATHCRIDSLFCGVMLGYLAEFRPEIFSKLRTPASLFFGLTLVVIAMLRWRTTTTLLLSLGFGLILCWFVPRRPQQIFRPFAWIGRYSYSIYLWQQPFMFLYGVRPGAMHFVVIVSAAIGVGVMMAKIVEIPILRLRDRLLPAGEKVPDTSVSGLFRIREQIPTLAFQKTPSAS